MTENAENTGAEAGTDTAAGTPAAAPELTPAQKAAATRAAKAATATATATAAEATPAKPKRVKIILEENDAIPPTGQFFGVNGTGYQIQPGKEVEVPEFLLDVLNNAVATKPVLNEDSQVIGYRDVPRFPYRIIK